MISRGFLSVWLVAAPAVLAEPQALHLTAEPPFVEVTRLAPGRQALQLPTLEFSIGIDARCSNDWAAESLALNIADSRETLGARELAELPQTVVMRIPARQLSPVVINGFCVGTGGDDATSPDEAGNGPPPGAAGGDRELTIDGAASLHASLLCGNGTERRMTYVSTPLAVTLQCRAPEQAAADTR